jgi:hypothetical protein
MQIRDILPSTRFALIAGSIFASGGLIVAAYALTHHAPSAPQSVAVDSNITQNTDWKTQLENIQSQSPANRAPQAPSADKVSALLNAATSDNLTDTVARTLLVNLSNAKAQGLGDDIPTQNQLIGQAASQISQRPAKIVYANADLTLSANTPAAMSSYGNAFMAAIQAHPYASHDAVVYAVATATDNGDPKRLAPLTAIGKDYAALAKDLSDLPVPSTLAPLHLKIINDLERMAEAMPDLKSIYDDPLRALASLQFFEALNQETLRLFINIAQEFSQNGILFNKDDPGQAWSALVP